MINFTNYKNVLSVCDKARDASGIMHSLTGAISMSQIFDNACYRPSNFKTYEYIDPITYAKYGEKSLWFMDSRILWTADAIREYFNLPCVINNYITAKDGDIYKESGLRYDTALGAERSQHLYGRAVDIKIHGLSADDARKEILDKQKTEPAFRFITAIELDVSWLHVDCRNTESDTIYTFTKSA